MTEEQISKGNKLIADFMGYKPNRGAILINGKWIKADLYTMEHEYLDDYDTCSFSNCYTAQTMEYHTSWEWLMPVIENIESLNYSTGLNFIPGTGHIFVFLSAGAEVNSSKCYNSKIEAAWTAVTNFIEWYTDRTGTVAQTTAL